MPPIVLRPPVASVAASAGAPGSLPARVTGPGRQNQNVLSTPAVVARAPSHALGGRNSARTSAAPGAPVLTPTDRVRKSIDRNNERRSMDQRGLEQAEPLEPTLQQVVEDPLERLEADLEALSLQHAAALTSASPTPSTPTSEHREQRERERETLPRGRQGGRPLRGASTTSLGSISGHGPSGLSSSTRCDLGETGLPAQLLALRDPACPVALPPPGGLPASCLPLDNWKLDKLVLSLSANKATWRRSLLLFEWLKAANHQLDDRLCTTLIRVCSDHGDAVSALAVYDWMTGSTASGGAALEPTAYTYTAAMRAALAGGLTERALAIWNEAWRRHTAGRLALDCRLCITYLELCTRMGLTDQALAMYAAMRAAPPNSRMAPTVHAYTAAMRAATEGGRWYRALDIWADMRAAGCEPTGHAYSAAISACAAAGDWRRAVALFDEMTGPGAIRPDVVSCTALITALAAGGEADRAEAVVAWMLANSVRPNARTYTALMAALGNAKRWARAVEVLGRMTTPEWGGVQPNAYTYSALLKSLGEHGQWQLAEAVFSSIERQVLGPAGAAAPPAAAAMSLASALVPAAAPLPSPLASMLAAANAGVNANVSFESLTAAIAATLPAVAAEAPASTLTASFAQPPPPPPPLLDNGMGPTQWTRPSQLHGLSLDLHAAARPHAAADAESAGPSRKSFSLFSHPPSATPGASPAASAYAWSTSSSTSDGSSSAADTWRAALEGISAEALTGQLAIAAIAANNGCGPAAALPAAAVAAVVAGSASPYSALSRAAFPGRSGVAALPTEDGLVSPGVYVPGVAPPPPPPPPPPPMRDHRDHHHHPAGPVPGAVGAGGVLNEVVCGALMLAYERAGKWQEAVGVLLRALNLGITPNTVMYNTAISAAGKAGQLEIAEKLYGKVRQPDVVTHEAMIAAYGMAGLPERAEAVFGALTSSGLRPRDFAFCGLIAAHSLAGNWEGAMRVRARMRRAGVQPSVHVYNALLAACERAGQPDRALELLAAMRREGVETNSLTAQLLALVGAQGVRSVESQQVAAAALSAAVAAYGTLLMQTGIF